MLTPKSYPFILLLFQFCSACPASGTFVCSFLSLSLFNLSDNFNSLYLKAVNGEVETRIHEDKA